MKRRGSLIVLSGPSGVGKSTLVKAAMQHFSSLEFSVSCTTRKPREDEVDGRDYHFMTAEEFSDRSAKGDFLEEAVIFGNRYGTPKSEVQARLDLGRDVLLDIDLQGARSIRKAAEESPRIAASVAFVMIIPPSMEELEKRLRGRNTETDEQLALRIGAARREMDGFRIYDYVIVNDDLGTATGEFLALLASLKLRSSLIEGDIFP